jgi:cyclic beta-1,2-glucan synthetase
MAFVGDYDERALRRNMGALAAELTTDGMRELTIRRETREFMGRVSVRAAELGARTDSEPLIRLSESSRVMEACARQAYLDGGMRLPAGGPDTRVFLIAEKLCAGGDACLDADRLMLAVTAFDDVQSLTMAELWAVPEAMRVAVCKAYARVATNIIRAAEARAAAEDWVYAGGNDDALSKRAPAFYERALQLALELEKPDLRLRIENALARQDTSPEACIRRTHEAQALSMLRIDNLLAVKRMLDAADWQKCFERASRAEIELRCDPSGVYPRMTRESRAAVREQLEIIARRLGVGELTVARYAVNAARDGARENDPADVRGGVCWWLYADEGRAQLARRLGMRRRLPKMRVDPRGSLYIFLSAAFSLLLAFGFAGACGSYWYALLTFPPAWGLSGFALSQIVTRALAPRRLLRMDYDQLPRDRRALVVIPALIPTPERAGELTAQLETLGCLDADDNIDYMLLGDFRDSSEPEEEGDAEILEAARAGVRRLNERIGRAKYHYLHRARGYARRDGLYRGRARKRGALMALCRVIQNGGTDEFTAESDACRLIAGRFRYLVTLDADTKLLPGAAREMVATIAHPLNARHEVGSRREGYAILQPMVEMNPAENRNLFARLFAGAGGLSSYSVMISNLYQDLCGVGNYCGKGVIDIAPFAAALEGALDDERILSHDLIEGLLAGAGQLNDVAVFDGYPENHAKYLKRLARWTRGDWQLLPELFRKTLSALGRFRILDNLVQSLEAPALFLLLVLSVWFQSRGGFSIGVVLALIQPFLALLLGDRDAFRRGCVKLAALPAEAYARLDAMLRALYRMFFSHKNLLDWVTSADQAGDARAFKTACRAAAILLLPGLLLGHWIVPTLSLGALFLIAPGWLTEMEAEPAEPRQPLTLQQVSTLTQLSRDTWKFFARFVGARENYLPPDNVQMDPFVGPARRTSPTNVGLYLLSCLSARELGFLGDEDLTGRLENTLDTLDKLERWNGHFYNWYDIDSLLPLKPRYVSAVDSGNLAACLLLIAAALSDAPVAVRMREMARAMDFRRLFDGERELFFIGADVENARMSASHYDLLASESRILSFTAMMMGQTGIENWMKLSRPVADGALLSWSGTMFEYLMPSIFMRAAPGTLISRTEHQAIEAQMRYAKARNRPWGVSESGHYAFDMYLNYQYRAFGMRAMALGGPVPQEVVAPYATVLALSARPADAARNIERMLNLSWAGECGFYEAADYARKSPRIVKSWMAHHQGMALCALCNALTGDSLVRHFMRIPEARALSLLLNERPAARIRLEKAKDVRDVRRQRPEPRRARVGKAKTRIADTALLGGAGACVLLTARGDMAYSRNGILASRFSGDLLRRSDGIRTMLRDTESGEEVCVNSPESRFVSEAGLAIYAAKLGYVEAEMRVTVSPEDGALVRRIALTNTGDVPREIELTDFFEAALMSAGEMNAHPAFYQLFLTADLSRENAIAYRRRGRKPGEEFPALLHAVSGAEDVRRETDWMRLRGRTGELSRAFAGTDGYPVNPASALRAKVELEPEKQRAVTFAVGLCPEADIEAFFEKHASWEASERAAQLSQTQAQALLSFTGLDCEKQHIIDRAAALLVDPRLTARPGTGPCAEAPGVPGFMPLIVVTLDSADALTVLRDLVRMHEYCRSLGFVFHLAAINDYGNDYNQPVRDGIEEMIGAGYLRDLRWQPGGISVFDAECLDPGAREALLRGANIVVNGRSSLWSQLRRLLLLLEYAGRDTYQPMRADAPAHEEEGYGRLIADGYEIFVAPDKRPPAPWSNIIASDRMGMLVTERGGGFVWHLNSRLRRVTPFDNDPAEEGWGLMFYLTDEKRGTFARLFPGRDPLIPYTVRHMLHETVFSGAAGGLTFETALFADSRVDAVRVLVTVKNVGAQPRELAVTGFVDWLMGADAPDAVKTRAWNRDGALFAAGAMDAVGYLSCDSEFCECGPARAAFLGHGGVMCPDALMEKRGGGGGHALRARLRLAPGEEGVVCFTLGCERDVDAAYAVARRVALEKGGAREREIAREEWTARRGAFTLETGEKDLDSLVNGFFVKQVLDGRIRARAGLYQAGGAFGFRDQLQDMLAILPYDPERVRAHILASAEKQFSDGDVMHWWHAPATGVRTRISDDLLFLPYVCAQYIRQTGDRRILECEVGFLANVEIPEGAEDWYGAARTSGEVATLNEHCLRAFRHALRYGAHGLVLMGTGDWNDGMNRVGQDGKGESVWLSMFAVVCARLYADLLHDCEDRRMLLKAADDLTKAVEENAWDGNWYLRAFADDGQSFGGRASEECRIDLISQAWAALAGLDARRVGIALASARDALFDQNAGVIRLLTPPFSGTQRDPGYIASYPPGVRENGGQYTHAACWYLLALSARGDAENARNALSALLPVSHARDRAACDIYRVEPYVLAADVYGEPPYVGRGGWTWYTGSAGWFLCAVRALAGYERAGNRVRLNALSGLWDEARVTLAYGMTKYTLLSDALATKVTRDGAPVEGDWIDLVDDGAPHTCVFPQRPAENRPDRVWIAAADGAAHTAGIAP